MIRITGLSKTYASGTKAVIDLNLTIEEGEIFALLGPNGAGKSSAIKILTTLSGFDNGQAMVAGYNVDSEPNKVRQSIGYVAQETGVDYFLTGRENMKLQGHLYRMTKQDIISRIDELSSYFDLVKPLDDLVSSYSGGMRRKLDIAMALIHRPKVIFLDEPTLGLDTKSRHSLWKYIEKLNTELGLTILLTTHYLEEADSLSHRVAIIDAGQIKIIDTPETLKSNIHGDVVSLEFAENTNSTDELSWELKQQDFVKDTVWENAKLHLYVNNGAESIPKIVTFTNKNNVELKNISFSRPTLDDVFIQYTGNSLDGNKEEAGEQWWEKWAGKGGGGKWSNKWNEAEKDSPNSVENEPKPDEDWKKWQSSEKNTTENTSGKSSGNNDWKKWQNNGNNDTKWP